MHSHSHGPSKHGRAFAIAIALNVALVVAQVIAGWLANSMSLVADAAHNLSDVLGLVLAWVATWLGARRPTARRTYGLRRSSILAALLNAILLLVATGALAWEALQRFSRPTPISGGVMIAVAIAAVAINGLSALLFVKSHGDLNLRGAFLHLVADAGVSLGVALAGVGILVTGWLWLDPAMSLLIGAVIVVGTWRLLRESLDLALDAVPEGIDPAEVERYLRGLADVTEVHDLHIWAMSTSETALTAHLVVPGGGFGDERLAGVCAELHERFGIEHSTIQVERGSADCGSPRHV